MNRRLLILLACAPMAAITQGAPPPKPEIYFRAPSNGATVSATFPVAFGLRNYGVAPAGVNINGAGHFHILVDVEPPAVGVVIPPNDSVHRHFGTGAIETTLTLKPGVHSLRLVLGDFEHKVISTDLISAPIRITVR